MAKAFKKLNFIDLKLHNQFDGAYSTISRWNDAIMDYLTDNDDSGDFSAICISGMSTGDTSGTGNQQNDARRIKINNEEHLVVKIRRMGAIGSARPHPRANATTPDQSEFLIGLHEEAVADQPVSKGLKSINPGDQIKCYYTNFSFINAAGSEVTKQMLMFRADSVGTSFINFLAKPFKDNEPATSDSFNNTQKPNFLGPTQPNGTNGRFFPEQLVDIGGGHKLRAEAAAAYSKMFRAALLDGIAWRITESYRTIQTQIAYAKPPPEGKGLYGQKYVVGGKEVIGLAARPGTSKHGLGLAVDIAVASNPKAYDWLVANAARFNFHTIPREPWHWEYRG